jgi:signal transduction histidine kinase
VFTRISRLLALQFTGFVFVLLLVVGVVFLAADLQNAHRQTEGRLARTTQFITEQTLLDPRAVSLTLPPQLRQSMRLLNASGTTLYTGEILDGEPFVPRKGLTRLFINGEQFSVLTSGISLRGKLVGYVQVAELERLQFGDLPERAGIFVFVSLLISGLTYIAGLSFARKSLAPAVRMVEELEQFTQDASHELRTPLAALSSSLDLALKTGKYKEGIVSAKEDLVQIGSLTEHLLELARLDSFTINREEVNFSSIVEQTIDRHSLLASEKGLTIESKITADIAIDGDSALVRQVVENLLGNAVKYSPNGSGPILVTLKKGELIVQDHGIGIAEDIQSHIFDRFYQADASRAHGGFGLGLSLVKRILDLHGWTIECESKEQKGTTFRVRFPVA